MNRRTLLTIVVSFILAGCATVPPLNTPSQRPEVTITGASKKEILDTLVAEMLSRGAQVKRIDEYSAVFGIRDDSFTGALLFGSRYDSTPEARVTFNLVETGNGIRVFGNSAMVTNPGSAFERVTDMTGGKLAHDMQAALERLKARVQSGLPENPPRASAALVAAEPAPPAAVVAQVAVAAPQPMNILALAVTTAKNSGCKLTGDVKMVSQSQGVSKFEAPCRGNKRPMKIICRNDDCKRDWIQAFP